MSLKRLVFAAACAIIALALPVSAQDAKYPTRPARILVPFTAGTITDMLARAFAQKLGERLGQPFVVETRAGAGGVIASQALLGSPADGHVLMFVSSAHAANPSLNKNLPYDTIREFAGIAMVGDTPTVIVVHPDVGVRTQAELVALAKKKPGKLNFSTPGMGSAAHFACEYFRAEAGIDLVHIPFKGTEYMTEVLSGRAYVACPPIGLATPHLRSGKLIALSVTSRERSSAFPDMPTTIETGLRDFEYGIWYGLVASGKTSRPILEQLGREMSAIVKFKEVSDAMLAQGVTPRDLTGAGFDAFIRSEIRKLAMVAKASGVAAN